MKNKRTVSQLREILENLEKEGLGDRHIHDSECIEFVPITNVKVLVDAKHEYERAENEKDSDIIVVFESDYLGG